MSIERKYRQRRFLRNLRRMLKTAASPLPLVALTAAIYFGFPWVSHMFDNATNILRDSELYMFPSIEVTPNGYRVERRTSALTDRATRPWTRLEEIPEKFRKRPELLEPLDEPREKPGPAIEPERPIRPRDEPRRPPPRYGTTVITKTLCATPCGVAHFLFIRTGRCLSL